MLKLPEALGGQGEIRGRITFNQVVVGSIDRAHHSSWNKISVGTGKMGPENSPNANNAGAGPDQRLYKPMRMTSSGPIGLV